MDTAEATAKQGGALGTEAQKELTMYRNLLQSVNAHVDKYRQGMTLIDQAHQEE